MKLFARCTNPATGREWFVYQGSNYIRVTGEGWKRQASAIARRFDPARLPA
jgi:hypothetical protein